MEQILQHYVRSVDEHPYKLYPNQLIAHKEEMERFREKVIKAARKFDIQYNCLTDVAQNRTTDEILQERIVAGVKYFKKEMEPQYFALIGDHVLATDDKELKKQLSKAEGEPNTIFPQKDDLLIYAIENGFHTADSLRQRATLSIGEQVTSGKEDLKRRGMLETVERNIQERKRQEAEVATT